MAVVVLTKPTFELGQAPARRISWTFSFIFTSYCFQIESIHSLSGRRNHLRVRVTSSYPLLTLVLVPCERWTVPATFRRNPWLPRTMTLYRIGISWSTLISPSHPASTQSNLLRDVFGNHDSFPQSSVHSHPDGTVACWLPGWKTGSWTIGGWRRQSRTGGRHHGRKMISLWRRKIQKAWLWMFSSR